MVNSNIREEIVKIRAFLTKRGLFREDEKDLLCLGFDKETLFDLFISRTVAYSVYDDEYIERWIETLIRNTKLHSNLIPVSNIEKWHIDMQTGNIIHASGRFFSITGLKVRHRLRSEEIEWDQPIIDQPEVGILGIVTKKLEGVLHFCLQAKEEPGNINSVQLAPTVQATYSNYSRVHGGKLPPFIEMFLDPPREKVLFSRLQPEDGGRFFLKSNKNIIILADEDEVRTLPDDFIWLTLRQIGVLLERDNLINSCTRSVLSCLI